MEKLKIGVLGISNHLLKRIVLPLKDTQHCEIYAVGSRNIDKAQQMAVTFDIPLWFGSYQGVIDCPEVDMIYIPLPNRLHYEWVIKALEAGKPVLCEKPLGMNAQEAREMVAKAHEVGTPLMEGFMYRFHPLWQHVRNIITTNQIGPIQYVHTSFSYNNPDAGNIRNQPAMGGGALMDIGCYAISTARFVFGREPVRVSALMSAHPQFGTDSATTGILDFAGPRATFSVSTMAQSFQKVEIVARAGSITVPVPYNTFVDVPASIFVTDGLGCREVRFPTCNAYGLMMDAFAKALLMQTPMPLSGLESIRNMQVMDAIRASADSDHWVSVEGA